MTDSTGLLSDPTQLPFKPQRGFSSPFIDQVSSFCLRFSFLYRTLNVSCKQGLPTTQLPVSEKHLFLPSIPLIFERDKVTRYRLLLCLCCECFIVVLFEWCVRN